MTLVKIHGNKGKKHSFEHTQKIANANTGQTRTVEQRYKMHMARLGKVLSEEHKNKISNSLKRIGHAPIWQKGPKHHNWKGDRVGYFALHDWIERQRGKARYLVCEKKDDTCKGHLEWSNISREYHRDVNDFQVLCVSHHTRYDKERKTHGRTH